MVSCLLIVVAVISYTRGLSVTDSLIRQPSPVDSRL